MVGVFDSAVPEDVVLHVPVDWADVGAEGWLRFALHLGEEFRICLPTSFNWSLYFIIFFILVAIIFLSFSL